MSAPPRIKICGINSAAAFDATVAAGADYLGFVFFPASPRYVTPAEAARLSARHAGGPLRVGLFVEPDERDIAAVLEGVDLDILQLYAPPEAALRIKTRFGLAVWRGIGVATAADLPGGDDPSDGYVIEAKPPPAATRPGGNAAIMDWSLLRNWRAGRPALLAGGLTPENVARALADSGAPGVDVSSGVETAPGQKSPELIRRFAAAARKASSAF